MVENREEVKIGKQNSILLIIAGLIFVSTLIFSFSLFFISNKLDKIIVSLDNFNKQISIDNLANTGQPSALSLKIGEKAPPFNMVSLDGKNYSLDQFKNKNKVILTAWTPTCAHCEAVLSELEKYMNTNKKDIAVISVARAINDEQKKEVSNKVKKYKLSFPVLLSTASDAFGSNYRVRAVPTMWIIGKTGLIEGVYSGGENISPILKGGKL